MTVGATTKRPAGGRGKDAKTRSPYPLHRSNQRELQPTYEGPVVFCDIDKTYLATDFESLTGLLAIPFEFAVDKRAITGMAALLREVRRGPGARSRLTPLYFISASPPQLRATLQKKMLLDGVEFDGVTFKDQLKILRRGRMGRLREHVSFKLMALLLYRAELPSGVREILIGDDTESDALCYTLYADAVAGRLRGDELRHTLERHHVSKGDAARVAERVAALEPKDTVDRIYIHLEKRSPPERFKGYGRVTPTRDALQLGLDLWHHGFINLPGVVRVGAALAKKRQLPDLVASVLEARDRGLIDGAAAAEASAALAARKLWPAALSLEATESPAAPEPPRDPKTLLTPKKLLG